MGGIIQNKLEHVHVCIGSQFHGGGRCMPCKEIRLMLVRDFIYLLFCKGKRVLLLNAVCA